MKVTALFVLFGVALALAAEEPIPIISQDAEVNFDGSYHSSYETANGISASEKGVLKNPGVEDLEAEEVSGSFQYTGDDGKLYRVSYVANENGFQPTGDHLPVAPS